MTTRPWLRHYDYWVPPSLNYPQRALTEILDTSAIDCAGAPATAFLGAQMTFREIKVQSDAVSVSLAALGISKGDRGGIMLPNCPQYVVTARAPRRRRAVAGRAHCGRTRDRPGACARDARRPRGSSVHRRDDGHAERRDAFAPQHLLERRADGNLALPDVRARRSAVSRR